MAKKKAKRKNIRLLAQSTKKKVSKKKAAKKSTPRPRADSNLVASIETVVAELRFCRVELKAFNERIDLLLQYSEEEMENQAVEEEKDPRQLEMPLKNGEIKKEEKEDTPQPAPASSVDKNEVMNALQKVAGSKGMGEVKKVLDQYQISRLAELPEEKWGSFVETCQNHM